MGDTSRKMIIELIKHTITQKEYEEKESIISTVDASLQTLLSRKKINKTGDYYFLSTNGRKQLYREYPPRFIYTELDTLSLGMINLKHRKSKYTGYLDSIFG